MKTKLSKRINKYIDKHIQITSQHIISSKGTTIVKHTITYDGHGSIAIGKPMIVYGVAQQKGALKTIKRLAKHYIILFIKTGFINTRLKYTV